VRKVNSMNKHKKRLLEDIAEQLYGYREVVDTKDEQDVKKILDSAQAMSVAISRLLEDRMDDAENIVALHSYRFGY